MRDEYAQAAANEAHPLFADEHPNSVSWDDAKAGWRYIVRFRWAGDKHSSVYVRGGGRNWSKIWSFGGVRQYLDASDS